MKKRPAKKEFQSFEEFWPFYLSQHKNSVSRALHIAGTTAAVLWVWICLVMGTIEWTWLSLLLGYGPAWIGHYMVEKNRPATFRYPLWSLRGDFRMCFRTLFLGKLF